MGSRSFTHLGPLLQRCVEVEGQLLAIAVATGFTSSGIWLEPVLNRHSVIQTLTRTCPLCTSGHGFGCQGYKHVGCSPQFNTEWLFMVWRCSGVAGHGLYATVHARRHEGACLVGIARCRHVVSHSLSELKIRLLLFARFALQTSR